MKRRFLLLLLLTAIAALVLSACATGEEPTATVVPSATPTEEVVATEAVVATEEAAETEAVSATEETVATEAVAATEDTRAAVTEEAAETEEAAATEDVATAEVVMTEEATATEEMVVTEEATATEEMVVTEEATATEAMVVTEEATATEEMIVPTEAVVVTEEAVATEETAATEEASSGGVTSVCLVTDLGRINDGSFNQSAYNGMVRGADELGLTSTFIETQNQADYAANIDTCIADGYQAIVTVGFLIADATRAAAAAHPDLYFIGVDQFFAEPLPNLVGIQFREDQAGFLVGVMAGLMTESNIIGGVYGEEIPPVVKFRNGFEQGARYANPDVKTLGVYISSFVAPAEGAEAADNFIGEGADVIFGAGGPTGSGGILRAAEKGVKVIGVDQDEFNTTFGGGSTPGAEYLISSAMKRVDEGVYQMLNALTVGDFQFPTNSLYVMDASIDGVTFAPKHLADVPDDVTAQVQAVFDMLKSGELTTGVDPVTGALLDASSAATEEAVATEEVVMTEEATATEEMVVTEEATATEAMVVTEEATATEEMIVPTEAVVVTEEAVATEETAATEEASSGGVTSVCLVTDLGRINDGSFNQSAYNGMVRGADELGLTSTFIETQNQADYAANIDTCIADGYQAIVTVGFLIADATRAAAAAHPDLYFIGVDQFFAEPLPNLVGIQFREDQAGFLVGVMAGLMTESNIIGGVYGEEIPPVVKFRNGFEQGARYANPDVKTLGVYISSFVAPAEGAEAADNFIGEGADVIFGAGGPTGSGGILRAAEKGVKVIGVDQDEFNTTFGGGSTPGAEYLISSAMKRVDEGVYQMLNALTVGDFQFPTNSLYVMDASIDGITFAPKHLADVPDDVTAQVQAVFDMLKSGELTTGVDPVTGALLDASSAATEEAVATEEVAATATP